MEKYSIRLLKTEEELNYSFQLRRDVFCKEYNISEEEEFDSYDEISYHFGCFNLENNLIGSARLVINNKKAIFSRLVVKKEFRNQNIGKLLNDFRENFCFSYGVEEVYLNSTTIDFHKKQGFELVSDKIIIDSGIKTYKMKKKLPKLNIDLPVLGVKLVPTEKLRANSYNPNSVASAEMKLLDISITEDGYTQPIVTFYSILEDIYEIVDGFHRYRVGKERKKLSHLPVVVIEKPINNRMASTIRHNRARGKHGIESMGDIVKNLKNNGWDDSTIAKHLGMEPEELLRLKQIKNIADHYKNRAYSKSWEDIEE